MTDQELKDLVASLSVSQAQVTEQQKQTDKQLAQTDKQLEKTDKQVRALTKDIFGISNSMGLEAEEFFYNCIENKKQLGGIQFDYISQNDKITIKADNQEIDILLENGNHIGIVEVKNKVTKSTIKQLDKIIDKFYYFHPFFKGYKLIGAVAGKVFPKDLQKLALSKGYSVLTQKGKHMEQINPVLN